MEQCGELCDSCSHNTTKLSAEKCKVLRNNRRNKVRAICDTANVKQCNSEKLRKLSAIQKYRSTCLRRYVYAKEVKRCRRFKKTFVIPVFHVQRRPDNPFNVKNVVQNLRNVQMTSPSNKISEQNQDLSVAEEACYSNREKRIVKTRNWESIRYKYQLDYKEKLKMERENFLKEYAEKRRMTQRQQRAENIRTIYQNMEDRMKEASRKAIVAKETLIGLSSQRNSHLQMGENQQFFKTISESQCQSSACSSRSNMSESINFYHSNDGTNNGCDSVDLTQDYENRVSVPQSKVNQMRLVRNEHGNHHTDTNRSKIVNESNTVQLSGHLEHEVSKKMQRDDFDFSIPFNESNILIKVMTPDGRNPINRTNQSGSLLQETLQYAAEPKRDLNAPKRVSFDEEPKANATRHDTGSGNQWIQYIQNILNKGCNAQDEGVNKKVPIDHLKRKSPNKPNTSQSNDAIPKDYVDHRPIPVTSTIPVNSTISVSATIPVTAKVPKPNVSVAGISHATNYYDPSTSRIKHDQPVLSNPRLVRPKVMHPSPYFRPDMMRNNSQYNDHLDDPIGVTLTMPRHQPDPSNISQHMEYIYGNHPNYHPEFNMVRSRRLPLDISHSNLIGPAVYSPYDQAFVQYRNEMERMSQPCTDPYIHHNMHVTQFNPSVSFLSPRPAGPGPYRYVNPHHVHPVWIYPHLLER